MGCKSEGGGMSGYNKQVAGVGNVKWPDHKGRFCGLGGREKGLC
jgi:hypothetical protein